MEAQAEVMHNHNHIEDSVIVPEPAAPAQPSFDVQRLMARRQETLTNLNGAKADRDYMSQQLKQAEEAIRQQDDMIKRTEGSLIQLNQLITELDPNALKQPQQGGA